jgi:hypothetical protein
MTARFDLLVTADYPSRTAEFRLLDGAGNQLAYQSTDFKTIPAGRLQGLFDLRDYLRLYVDEAGQRAALGEIGVCIAEEVLGADIFKHLWAARTQRTLRIQLPGAAERENPLAAALARVPWELARPQAAAESLAERNLLVRVVHERQDAASTPMDLAPDEPLRVLFVFAEARGSQPLGMRRERRALQQFFAREVYPGRRVIAHFLSHGVTRERLIAQVRGQGGYHLVHWSGHGNLNLLELAKPGGASDPISGQDLLDLFLDAGGLLPRLMVLSACHSGDLLRVRDWDDFLAVAQGKEPATKEAPVAADPIRDLNLADQPGYTGTAHALLHGGVPSVVAMRYAVGDDYARELALHFYRALLADPRPKDAAAALTQARRALLAGPAEAPAWFQVCDHATPVLYGEEEPGLTLRPGRGGAPAAQGRRLHQIGELTTAAHPHFVGRTWELATLGADFIGTGPGAQTSPVAVIVGLGGMGKTALAAEALDLWEQDFTWVLTWQAKPSPLAFDAWLRDVHLKLWGELGRYHDQVQAHPAEAVHRNPEPDFTGPERQARLIHNLVRALNDEAILLVLDNFETNLKARAEPDAAGADPVWGCQDPVWDQCLEALAVGLVGGPSRVLITSRRPLAALARGSVRAADPTGLARGAVRAADPTGTTADPAGLSVLLGPLPAAEAALYLREQPTLGGMIFGTDQAEQRLARRLLHASRFHPLLMDRLARLAADPALRPRLLAALTALAEAKGFERLPGLFAMQPGDAAELAYLEDALGRSIGQLLDDLSPEARRLLWIIALANQPESLGLIWGVWGGEDGSQQGQLRQIKAMLDMLPMLPPETQAQVQALLTPEFRAMLDALPPAVPARPDPAPLLRRLVALGLVTEERAGAGDENPNLGCHELVRERIRDWMDRHAEDRADLTEDGVRLAYAQRLESAFNGLLHQDMTAAIQAGSRALVYCVQAAAWDQLSGFASALVTSTQDPVLLQALTPHLEAAADLAPAGKPRWSCLCYLADALWRAGRPDAGLTFYEQAAAQASAAAESGGEGAGWAWADLAAISGNWANALGDVGDLDAARRRHIESAEAFKRAGRPSVHIVAHELEALRIDIQQGQVATALPEVERRLAQVQGWWQQHRAGQLVPEAPDAESLARTLIGALDIARQADYAQEDWASALVRLDAILEVKRALQRPAEDIGADRMNRASVLMKMPRRLGEAKAELETCLALFENNPAWRATTLSSLADLFDRQGDRAQAITQQRRALALCEQLPNPADRAISHNNLALWLDGSGTPPALAESARHQLAALAYRLVAGLGQHLQTSLHNYAIVFRRARAAGTEPAIPLLAELLADPAFAPLAQWLRQRQVDAARLQAAIDQSLAQARQAAETP